MFHGRLHFRSNATFATTAVDEKLHQHEQRVFTIDLVLFNPVVYDVLQNKLTFNLSSLKIHVFDIEKKTNCQLRSVVFDHKIKTSFVFEWLSHVDSLCPTTTSTSAPCWFWCVVRSRVYLAINGLLDLAT